MIRRPTIATKFTRTLTALITVWCLGCSGYEPLLNSLFGQSSGMTCGSDMVGSMGMSESAPTSSVATATVSAAGDHGFDCGCGSCHSASPQTLAVHLDHPAPPTLNVAVVGEPLSVSRPPLAPPPQLGA